MSKLSKLINLRENPAHIQKLNKINAFLMDEIDDAFQYFTNLWTKHEIELDDYPTTVKDLYRSFLFKIPIKMICLSYYLMFSLMMVFHLKLLNLTPLRLLYKIGNDFLIILTNIIVIISWITISATYAFDKLKLKYAFDLYSPDDSKMIVIFTIISLWIVPLGVCLFYRIISDLDESSEYQKTGTVMTKPSLLSKSKIVNYFNATVIQEDDNE